MTPDTDKILDLLRDKDKTKIGVSMLVHLCDDDLFTVMKDLEMHYEAREFLRLSYYEMKDNRHWIQQKNFPVSCNWCRTRNCFIAAYTQGVLIRKKPCIKEMKERWVVWAKEFGNIEHNDKT